MVDTGFRLFQTQTVHNKELVTNSSKYITYLIKLPVMFSWTLTLNIVK